MLEQEKFMKEALKEAKKAYNKEEIPVGAIIVKDGKIIARSHNLKETKKNSTSHAEILAINKASKKLENWRLTECDMYITLEPCTMCIGAIISSRIRKIYIGTMDIKAGACGSVLNVLEYKFNHKVEIETGILKDECEYILKDFFKMLRKKKRRRQMKPNLLDKKTIHTYIIVVPIIFIILIVGLLILKYNVEGEKNLPFNLKQFSIISTATSIHNKGDENIWNANISQNNDIYFQIEKNIKYKKEEIIKNITFNNFVITKENNIGEIEIFRPSSDNNIYDYSDETQITDSLEYIGSNSTDTESLQINNQGGLIGFSILNKNIGTATFSQNEIIPSDGKLLKKANLTLNDIKFKISFDIIIETESQKKFKTSMSFDLPEGDILENGVESKTYSDLSSVVFKRF